MRKAGDVRHSEKVPDSRRLALAGFKALLRLVDDVCAAATTDHAVVPVTVFERLERVADLHDRLPVLN